MLFAYYEVLDPKLSMEELYEMNVSVLLPAFQKIAEFVDANKTFFQRILHFALTLTAKSDHKNDLSAGYIMSAEPYRKTEGIHYHFDRCPIAEFAKKHGYVNIMPAFCNADCPSMNMIHGTLIRKHTCANAHICDYWIVGDQSKNTKEHPKKTDTDGYWYND